MNIQEIIQQFKEAALDSGITLPDNIKADGQKHRFNIDGKPNGFYKLHPDGKPAGCFQNWKLHDKPINWKFDGEFKPFTVEERRQYALKRAAEEKKRQAEQAAIHQKAASIAVRVWQKATPAPVDYPYLVKKGVSPNGARILNDNLILPLYSEHLSLMSLEFIAPDGVKRFLKGGKKAGCFWWIGQKTERVLLCEGYATACTLYESTRLQTYIAFDAGNLVKVAQVIRAKRPQVQIVICGDNDESGKGQEAAEQAAIAVDGLVSLPPELGTDFNDFVIKSKEVRHG
ncbi:MAG: toprim domain-containing protein [Methylococcales bacterium]